MLRGWLRLLLDVVFPATCEGCNTTLPAGHPSCLCDACKAALGRAEGSLCERCGVPVASDSPCATCRTRPPAFERARAAGWYVSGSVLASAVQSLKYGRRLRPGAARSGGPSGRRLYRGAGTVTAGWWALRGRTRSAKGTVWSRPAF